MARQSVTPGKITLDNRVKKLRKRRGLTQNDMAALLGVSRQTIYAIEHRRFEPGLRLAMEIANVFAASIEDVFRLTPTPNENWTEIVLKIPQQLDAKTVYLRPHKPSDLPAFTRFVTDDNATRHMAFTKEQKTPEGAAALMEMVIASYTGDTPIFSLTIAHRETDTYLGAVGGADAGDGKMEIFVTLLPEAQGHGHATAALKTLADYLFTACQVTALQADIVPTNTPSVTLFQRLGFTPTKKVARAAEKGEFGHKDMQGMRYTLTAKTHRQQQANQLS